MRYELLIHRSIFIMMIVLGIHIYVRGNITTKNIEIIFLSKTN